MQVVSINYDEAHAVCVDGCREQVAATAAMLMEREGANAGDPLALKELDTSELKDWASVVSV